MLATRRGRLAIVVLAAIALGALLAVLRPHQREEEPEAPPPASLASAAAPAHAARAPAPPPHEAPPLAPSTPAPSVAPATSAKHLAPQSTPATSREASRALSKAPAPSREPAPAAAPSPAPSADASAPATGPPATSAEAPEQHVPSSTTGVIAVSCVDEVGLPVAGVKVGLTPDDGITLDATSDARGWAERAVAPGRYRVSQWMWTVVFERRPEVAVAVEAGERREVTLQVRRTGTLEGTVVGGTPANPRLRVVVRSGTSASRQEGTIQLDEAGRFTEQRTAGSYEMSILADDGASSAVQEVRVLPDQITRVTFAVGAGSPLVLGRVRTASDGRAIGGATVDADGCGVTTTDAAGEFVLRGSGGAPAAVNVRADGFIQTTIALDATRPPPLDVTVDLALGGALRVTVLDPDGKPAPDVSVSVRTRSGNRSSSYSTSADGEGLVKMNSLEPGTYRVFLKGSDEENPDATLEVRAGEEAQAQVTVKQR